MRYEEYVYLNQFLQYSKQAPDILKDALSNEKTPPSIETVLVLLAVNPRFMMALEQPEIDRLHNIFQDANPNVHHHLDTLFLFERKFLPRTDFQEDAFSRFNGQMRGWVELIEKSIHPRITIAVIQQRLYAEFMSALAQYDNERKLAENVVSPEARFSLLPRIADSIFSKMNLLYDHNERKLITLPNNLDLTGEVCTPAKLARNSQGIIGMASFVHNAYQYVNFQLPKKCSSDLYVSPRDMQLLELDEIPATLTALGYERVAVDPQLEAEGFSYYFIQTNNTEFWHQIKKSEHERANKKDDEYLAVRMKHYKLLEECGRRLQTREVVLGNLLVLDPQGYIISGWFDYGSPVKQDPSTGMPKIYKITDKFELLRLSNTWQICFLNGQTVQTIPIAAPAITDEDLTNQNVTIGPEVTLSITDKKQKVEKLILDIKNFNGVSIADIEKRMQPGLGLSDEYSTAGFLKPGDQLPKAIVDAFLTLQELSLTPRLLAKILQEFTTSPFLCYVLGAWYFGCHQFYMNHMPGWSRNDGFVRDPFTQNTDIQQTREYTFLQDLPSKEKITIGGATIKALKEDIGTNPLVAFTGIHIKMLASYCFLQTGPYYLDPRQLMDAITKGNNLTSTRPSRLLASSAEIMPEEISAEPQLTSTTAPDPTMLESVVTSRVHDSDDSETLIRTEIEKLRLILENRFLTLVLYPEGFKLIKSPSSQPVTSAGKWQAFTIHTNNKEPAQNSDDVVMTHQNTFEQKCALVRLLLVAYIEMTEARETNYHYHGLFRAFGAYSKDHKLEAAYNLSQHLINSPSMAYEPPSHMIGPLTQGRLKMLFKMYQTYLAPTPIHQNTTPNPILSLL